MKTLFYKNQKRKLRNSKWFCILYQNKISRTHFFNYSLREYLIEFVQPDGNIFRLEKQRTKFILHFRSTSKFSRKLLTCFVGCTLYDTEWVRCKPPKCIVNYALCKMYLSLTFLHFPHINTDVPSFFPYARIYISCLIEYVD